LESSLGILIVILLALGSSLIYLPICLAPQDELVGNPSFEEWTRKGSLAGWDNITDPEASLERATDAVDGLYSLKMMNVRSYDVTIFQNITIPPGSEHEVDFSVSCKIEYSDDTDVDGVHSPTGIEVGFEGGDVDEDGYSEYLYFYFFVDDHVVPEDFTVTAGIYNTTEGVDIHKIALLHQLESRGEWYSFDFDLSRIFMDTLGGYPRGEIKTMVWALRWGEPREDCGITGYVDGMSVSVPSMEVGEAILVSRTALVFSLVAGVHLWFSSGSRTVTG
jgi:hypothetical protein